MSGDCLETQGLQEADQHGSGIPLGIGNQLTFFGRCLNLSLRELVDGLL
jgi:hypothetical protein